MKLLLRLLAGALVLAVLAVASFVFYLRSASWRFVEEVTKFEFPSGTRYLARYDNAEWYVVCVVRLPPESVQNFIRTHRFSSGMRRGIPTSGALPARYREIPMHSDVLSASGQTEYQSWDAVLDPRTSLLWIHVAYPDWSGDHPGTAPQPTHKALEPTRGAVVPHSLWAASTEQESQLPRLSEVPAKYRDAAKAVVAVLVGEKEEPEEFRADILENDNGRMFVFHLWHDSAFTPENRGAVGNPGGRCRDVVYDVQRRKASRSIFWQ